MTCWMFQMMPKPLHVPRSCERIKLTFVMNISTSETMLQCNQTAFTPLQPLSIHAAPHLHYCIKMAFGWHAHKWCMFAACELFSIVLFSLSPIVCIQSSKAQCKIKQKAILAKWIEQKKKKRSIPETSALSCLYSSSSITTAYLVNNKSTSVESFHFSRS